MNSKAIPGNSEHPVPAPARKGRFLKTVTWGLVCLWMFVLGVLTGRGTAPVHFNVPRLQEELLALKTSVIKETSKQYAIAFKELDKPAGLAFHEELMKDPKGDIASPVPLQPESKPEAASPAADSAPASQAPSPPSETPAAAAPIAAAETAPLPDTPEKPDEKPAGGWMIQVAATQEEMYGNQVVARLKKLGLKAYLTAAEVPDRGTWYRIRVGGYQSKDAAQADLARLKQERFSPIIINP